MKRLLLLSAAALVLSGCASTGANTAGPGSADAREVQQRLVRLAVAGVPLANFSLAKAQCWLDTAHTQRSENDRTGYVEEAVAEAARIAGALEADRNTDAGRTTPLIARSTRLREDLWTKLDGMAARSNAPSCNARTVACGQVRLVRAGHAHEQTGWRGATPFIQMAEDAVERGAAEAAQCAAPVAGTGAPAVAAAPAPVAPAALPPAAPAAASSAVSSERFVILADTLFRFGKSGPQDILPDGKARLEELAGKLKGYTRVQSISITGHTDRLGSDAYNDKLSRDRAATVRAYFEAQGIRAASLDAQGKGKREPVTQGCASTLPRAALVRCLQPDRRVTIEVAGTAP